jgi:hypothetical protein
VDILDVDPLTLPLRGVDLTVDWFGRELADFRSSVTVLANRTFGEVCNPNGDLEKLRYTSGKPETLYYGKMASNDFLRIYDKAVERRDCGGLKQLPDLPWIRIERALKGKHIPEELSTLGRLVEHGCSFDPFQCLQINTTFDDALRPDDFFTWPGAKLNHQQNACWVFLLIQRHGKQQAARLIRELEHPVKKKLELFERALTELGAALPMPSAADLTNKFQQALRVQLGLTKAQSL